MTDFLFSRNVLRRPRWVDHAGVVPDPANKTTDKPQSLGRRLPARKNRALLAAVTALTVGFFSTGAFAACDPFPDSGFGKPLSHARAVDYVRQKFNGNWQPFIAYMENQLERVEQVSESGKTARINRDGESVVLSREQLSDYVSMARSRLEVAQCLAQQSGGTELIALNSLPTLGGDETPVTEVQPRPDGTGADGRQMNLEVSSVCSNGVSLFKVKNRGPDWPSSSALTIYRIDGRYKQSVSSRRMRLKQGQVVSFSVKRSQNRSGNLGLFIDPAWYARKFAYDATLVCR